jgi:peptidyl-dipeptidase Dcp
MTATTNPLLMPWPAPHGLPPFDAARADHFEPAMREAMGVHRQEVAELAALEAPPSFDNTVAAFDRTGRLLRRVCAVFDHLVASATSPELQAVESAMVGPLAAHHSAVHTDAGFFARLDSLYAERHALRLTPEELRLLERVHLDFVQAGARLDPPARARYAALMQAQAELSTRFSHNLLHDESAWHLHLVEPDDFAGLPEAVGNTARQAAKERGLAGGVIALSRSLVLQFLTFSTRRDLREQVWRAWSARGRNSGERDNRELAREFLRLRTQQARAHGYASYADYALADTMAGSREEVQQLFDEVWPRALAAVGRERQALLAQMAAAGQAGEIEPWDWRFWAEKVRRAHYDIDDAEVKPYFELNNLVGAAFDCAERLFGLRFSLRSDLAGYHPDVQVYEVRNARGELSAFFYLDNFARANKVSGAWMSALRWQHRNVEGGGAAIPVIVNNNNFTRGAPGEPTLLSLDGARILFHEFGHGLHGLLSDVRFERLSGIQVLLDFVEFPSQLFENWIREPEVLQRHARHYLTGEPIPPALVQRLTKAQRFNRGYETVRYMSSAIVDMAVHSLGDDEPPADLCRFEADVLRQRGMPHAVELNHHLAHFHQIFSLYGYGSRFYVYLWSDVLAADGYAAFAEAGDPFDPVVAKRLRQHVYATGNSVEPGAAYAAFRGRPATVMPLLVKRALVHPDGDELGIASPVSAPVSPGA